MDWFEEVFKAPLEAKRSLPPPFELKEGEAKVVKFLESNVRVVQTSYGKRPVIIVECDGERYSLWLSRMVLAREIALLEKQLGSLENVTVRLRNRGKKGRAYIYEVSKI